MFWDSRPGMTVLKTKQFHWLDVFNAPTISIPLSPAPQKKKKKETQENKTNPLLPTPPKKSKKKNQPTQHLQIRKESTIYSGVRIL